MPVKILASAEIGGIGRLILQIANRYPKADLITVSSGQDGNHGPTSHHYGLTYKGSPTAALDFVGVAGGGVTADDAQRMSTFAAWWKTNFTGETVELIHSGGAGYFVKNGRVVNPYARRAHWDHIHVATSKALAERILARLEPRVAASKQLPGPVAIGNDAMGRYGTKDAREVPYSECPAMPIGFGGQENRSQALWADYWYRLMAKFSPGYFAQITSKAKGIQEIQRHEIGPVTMKVSERMVKQIDGSAPEFNGVIPPSAWRTYQPETWAE
jgi:hypothetical protein